MTPEAAAVLPDLFRPLAAEWPGAVHERFPAGPGDTPDRPAAADAGGVWTWRASTRRAAGSRRGS